MKTDPLSVENLLDDAHRLSEAGRIDEADAAYEQIARSYPRRPEPYHSLGLIAHGKRNDDRALALISRAASLDPENPVYYNDIGLILHRRGNAGQAIACFRKALEVRPEHAGIYNNLGNACQKIGKCNEAISCYRKAIRIDPGLTEAHNNLGNAFHSQGMTEEAISSFQEALRLKPDYANAWNNLASVFRDLGRLEEAVICYRSALSINPDFPEVFNNMGATLCDQGKNGEALSAFRKALSLKPDYIEAHSNFLFALQYDPEATPAFLREESNEWWRAQGLPRAGKHTAPAAVSPGEKLRIGYVSPDFRRHSVSFFFLPLLSAHDRKKVEIFLYGEVRRPDKTTERIRSLSDHWRSTVGITGERLAEQIRSDGIHILVDLAGHTTGNRLDVFARRPAPVQITWLGYPNTTGIPEIDYRITDPVADPPGEADSFYSETLLRLNGGFLCYAPPEPSPEVGELPMLKNGCVTFGSFNTLPKLNPKTVSVWAEILKSIPGSRLLLKARQLADPGASGYVLSLFEREGIPGDRITLLPRTPDSNEHLVTYRRIDIGLDPFPYNGTTTTCEALWMGVPVVTLRGNRHAARVGASLLTRIGLTELVAETARDYVDIVARLARDPDRLAALHMILRPRMAASPLCDAASFGREMEAAFEKTWKRFVEKEEACSTGVEIPIESLRRIRKETVPVLLQSGDSEIDAAYGGGTGIEHLETLFTLPGWFREPGEAEACARFLGAMTTRVHRGILENPGSAFWRKAGRIYLEKANFIPLYFSHRPLSDIYRKRSEIAASVLSGAGYSLAERLPHGNPEGKIRLGIHFRSIRPGPEAFAAFPLFYGLDRDRFEIFLYVHRTDGNRLENMARSLAGRFVTLPENLKASAQIIRGDRLDILFFSGNTTAVTNESFILSCHRLARFQGVHFASPVTTGQPEIDFFLLGSGINAGCRQGAFSERILEVDGSGICFHPEALLPPRSGEWVREKLGLPRAAPLFVSGANFFKIVPDLRETWAELISRVPGSKLVIYPFGPSWSAQYPKDAFVSGLRETFGKRGVALDRLFVLDSFARREEIADLLAACDIYLDAVPYSGATSLLDPLAAGLPIVVGEGDELRFRQGGAMLRELGIPELVAPDRESYLRLAAGLGRDPSLREYFREMIRTRMKNTPPFLDMARFGRHIEGAVLTLLREN